MSTEVLEQPKEQPPSVEEQPTVYSWLASNPIATSTGTAISSLYTASKNYNRVTQTAIGSLETAVTYAAGTAKPVVGAVTGKLEKPITAVDGVVANGLVSLEKRYPVLGKDPNEIATDSKEAIKSTIVSGHEALGGTRVGQVIGQGVGYTLTMAEGIVDRVLPPEEEEVMKDDDDDTGEEEGPSGATPKTSWLGGLRRRKTKDVEMKEVIESETSVTEKAAVVPPSNVERLCKLSSTVYYRGLASVKVLQEQCHDALRRLKVSLKLLQYANTVTSGLDQQRQNVAQALRDAETKIRNFLTRKTQKEDETNEEFASWLTDDQDSNEDIQWLLQAGKKKDMFQLSLDYAKSASEKVYETFQSFSGITSYLPARLREGASSGLQQAKDIYTTLKLNNVPSELPSFLLSQITEIVETQILYCKKLGAHLTTALKKRFCSEAELGGDTGSTAGDSEIQMDEIEEETSADDEASSND